MRRMKKMREFTDLVAGLSGFFVGIITILIIFYFFKKYGKKKRLFDERYYQVQRQARSTAWTISTFCIVIAWMVAIIVDGPGFPFFLITFIYIAHMISYLIGGIRAEQKY